MFYLGVFWGPNFAPPPPLSLCAAGGHTKGRGVGRGEWEVGKGEWEEGSGNRGVGSGKRGIVGHNGS